MEKEDQEAEGENQVEDTDPVEGENQAVAEENQAVEEAAEK